jgi:predicted RNase H-like HicB family nuclease
MNSRFPLYHTINAFIRKGEKYYVAECVEIGVVTQGKTLDKTIANLRQAVALHLDGEDLAEMRLAPKPSFC